MTRDLPDVPEELIDAGARDLLLVVVGAGASMADSATSPALGLPSWKGLLGDLTAEAVASGRLDAETEKAVREAITDNDLATAASMLRGPWMYARVAARFSDPTLRPTSKHAALAALPGALYLTTNYDCLLERALQEAGRPGHACTLREIDAIAQLDVGGVLKLHGDACGARDIVLALEDYTDIYERPEAWRRVLSAYVTRGRVLFVGYSYQDQHLVDEVTKVLADFEGYRKGPYWLELRSKRVEAIAKARRLQLIPLEENYDHVTPFIEALAEKIRRRKDLRSGTQLSTVVKTHLPHDRQEAHQHFAEGRFDEALSLYQKALDHLAALPEGPSPDNQKEAEECRLNVGACLLSLQRFDEARDVLLVVDLAPLDANARGVLAQGLVQLRELDRARAVLPPEPVRSAELARQLLEIAEGRLPDPLADDLTVTLPASNLLIQQGRAWGAAQRMMTALDTETHPQWRLAALERLYRAIHATIVELPLQQEPIPLDARSAVVGRFERELEAIDEARLSQVMKDRLLELQARYAWLTADRRFKELHESLLERGLLETRINTGASLDLEQHPWLGRLGRLAELAESDPVEARPVADALVREWPGRAPVEMTAAKILIEVGDIAAAVPHAEAAYAALPCDNFRKIAGLAMVRAASFEENRRPLLERAWGLLSTFQRETDPDVLQARAHAASTVAPGEAVGCWRQYAEAVDTPHAWLGLAQELLLRGREPEASEAALRVGSKGWPSLKAGDLVRCGQLLLACSPGVVLRPKLIAIAKALHEKMGAIADPELHSAYLSLYQNLAQPLELAPPDMKALEQLSVVASVPKEVGFELMWQQVARAVNAERAWRAGAVTFSQLCAAVGKSPAGLFVHLMADRAAHGAFPAPLPNAAFRRSLSSETQLLVGHLELQWLCELDLLDPLREQPGAVGTIVVFSDVFERAVREVEFAPHAEHERLTAIRARAQAQPGLVWHQQSAELDSDEALALRLGVPLVVDGAEGEAPIMSTAALVRALFAAGLLARDIAELAVRGTISDGPSVEEQVPPVLVLSYGPLMHFEAAGALDVLLGEARVEVHVGPATCALLDEQIANLGLEIEARRPARRIRDWLSTGRERGWLEVAERPPVPELADREIRERSPGAAAYLEELLQGWRWCRGARRILIAEAAMSALDPKGMVAAVNALTLGPMMAHPLKDMMAAVRKREVHLPDLIDRITPAGDAVSKREHLAEHGFVEALDSGVLGMLARRYGALDRGKPSRLLSGVVSAFGRTHYGQRVLLLYVAKVFAEALADVWLSAEPDAAVAERLTRALLDVAEEAGKSIMSAVNRTEQPAESHALVDVGVLTHPMLVFLGMTAFRYPTAAFNEVDDKYESGEGTRVGRMWRAIGAWAEGGHSRRLAADRAVADLWVSLDDHFRGLSGPPGPAVAGVEQATYALSSDTGSRALGRGALAALATISSTWQQQPLARIGQLFMFGTKQKFVPLSDVLGQCTQALIGGGEPLTEYVGNLQFPYDVDETLRVEAEVVAEAAVLRVHGQNIAEWARWTAWRLGPEDGRLHARFLRISENPDDSALIRAAGRAAASAPWRRLREDPSLLLAWQLGPMPFVSPHDLSELRAILSEPGPLPDEDLLTAISQRLNDDGVWAHRLDRWELLHALARIPGSLATISASLLEPEERAGQLLAAALKYLGSPEMVPAGWLSSSIIVLRVAAAQRAMWELPEGPVDLRAELPRLLERVVETLAPTTASAGLSSATGSIDPAARNAPSELAKREPQILRLCMRVVDQYAAWQMSPRERLWLTWRLATWYLTQLESTSPEARGTFLSRLDSQRLEPRPVGQDLGDVLDPSPYGSGRVEYRTIAVLHALLVSDDMARSIGEAGAYSVSTRGLLGALRRFASRELTDDERLLRKCRPTFSRLGWGSAATVPDLALLILLRLDSAQWAATQPEVRLRWLQDVARGKSPPDAAPDTVRALVAIAAAEHVVELSADELTSLEAVHRRAQEAGDHEVARFAVAVALYGVGRIPLDPEVRRLLGARATREEWAALAGRHLLAVARVEPGRLAEEVHELRRLIEDGGGDLVAVALALGPAGTEAPQEGREEARAILAQLALEEPWTHDVRVRQLLAALEAKPWT